MDQCVDSWEDLLRKGLTPHNVGELVVRWYRGTILFSFYPDDPSEPIQTATMVTQMWTTGLASWKGLYRVSMPWNSSSTI